MKKLDDRISTEERKELMFRSFHRRLWNWKTNFPLLDNDGFYSLPTVPLGMKDIHPDTCFACEVAKKRWWKEHNRSYNTAAEFCEFCPIKWHGGVKCNQVGSLWQNYRIAVKNGNERSASLYAQIIANLPWDCVDKIKLRLKGLGTLIHEVIEGKIEDLELGAEQKIRAIVRDELRKKEPPVIVINEVKTDYDEEKAKEQIREFMHHFPGAVHWHENLVKMYEDIPYEGQIGEAVASFEEIANVGMAKREELEMEHAKSMGYMWAKPERQPKNHCKGWTRVEEKIVQAMFADAIANIGRTLERTPGSIYARIKYKHKQTGSLLNWWGDKIL